MPQVFIDPAGPAPGFYAELITFSPGSPPDRPHPMPPLGIWGPTDPRPSNPITGIPGYPPPLGPNPPGEGPPPQPAVANALVLPLPPSATPTPPPTTGLAQMVVWFGPGTLPTHAWVAPYAATTPTPAK